MKRIFSILLAVSFVSFFMACFMACQPNAEKPGGFQGEGNINNPKNNEFNDLVADYNSKDRLIWQKPDMVITRLGDLSTQTVVDLGAGTGFFCF